MKNLNEMGNKARPTVVQHTKQHTPYVSPVYIKEVETGVKDVWVGKGWDNYCRYIWDYTLCKWVWSKGNVKPIGPLSNLIDRRILERSK